MTHTPGPWVLEKVSATEIGVRVHGSVVSGYATVIDTDWTTRAQQLEQEANARLIAAAPELLNELRVTVRRLELCIRHSGSTREFAEAATAQTWELIRRIEEGPS